MNPHLKAIRAISSIYVLEIIRPFAFLIVGGMLGLAAILLYLTVFWSAWWLVFLIPFTILFLFIAVVIFMVLSLARKVAPTLSKPQYDAAISYVKNMHDVNDRIRTPQPLIVFKIIMDLVRRRWKDGFIQQTTANSVKLKKDFDALVLSFE